MSLTTERKQQVIKEYATSSTDTGSPEVQIAIHHALLANCEPSQIRRIHSKPEALGQCRTWLATQFPRAELIAAPSSSRAAQTAVEEDRIAESIGAPPGSAAIGSVLAGQL